MSNVGKEGRSFLPIEKTDLLRLSEIARKDREQFFAKHPEWKRAYANRYLCTVLAQGAAQHYLDCKNGADVKRGINDFDVYSFYEKNPAKTWCYRRPVMSYDFGDPKFGRSLDRPSFIGRRVDCLGRAIKVNKGDDIKTALKKYLENSTSKTAKELKKALVLLNPNCEGIIWPASEK